MTACGNKLSGVCGDCVYLNKCRNDEITKLPKTNIEWMRTASANDVARLIATKLCELARHEYGIELVEWESVPRADCVVVAVGHNIFRSMSMMQIKKLFKDSLEDQERVLIDVKSLYRKEELDASGMRYWRT